MKQKLILIFLVTFISNTKAQENKTTFTKQDTLRGSNGKYRKSWDVKKYDLTIEPNYEDKFIKGVNKMSFVMKKSSKLMQIDLQEPMKIDSIVYGKTKLQYTREKNVYWVKTTRSMNKSIGKEQIIEIYFSGHPTIAKNPPWDGGWIFTKDDLGYPWMSVACQGLGASVWFPNKDYQGDEPDNGAKIRIITTDDLIGVSNGRYKAFTYKNGKNIMDWEVTSPINNYNISVYIGSYVPILDTMRGEEGELSLEYRVLDQHKKEAKEQFKQVKKTIKAFEYWFGPYPFYYDSYKLVEAPFLGMEHQSAVAYGNNFENGYEGRDLSGTGVGLKWDYIIVHESGHEWFGNNITAQDIADMWIQESFTAYSEILFTEFHFGKEDAVKYLKGTRKNMISNYKPIIGKFNVNNKGSDDMYYKGANMIHTIRQYAKDDEQFRQMLRGINKDFRHSVVTGEDIKNYISKYLEKDFKLFFKQYLETTKIPKLEYKLEKNTLKYRYTNVVEGYNYPLRTANNIWIKPTTEWKEMDWKGKDFRVLDEFYIHTQKVK